MVHSKLAVISLAILPALTTAYPGTGAHGSHKFTWPPLVKSVEILGNASDDTVNRDSCGTSRIYNRALWVCRDTQPNIALGHPQVLPVYTSSASWADFDSHGKPSIHLYGGNHEYTAYYPLTTDECPPPGPLVSECPATEVCPGPLNLEGLCSDRKKRYAMWPDSPPLLSGSGLLSALKLKTTGFTWIRKSLIGMDLSTYVSDPATSLYKVTFNRIGNGRDTLPSVELVDEEFWGQDQWPFGAYGNVVQGNVAYLLAQNSKGVVALARSPRSSLHKRSAYEYYVEGTWTREVPDLENAGVVVPNISAGGQGTYFWSDYWNKFVWIGQSAPSVVADFYITVADRMEGPWEKPHHFYSGVNGNYFLSAYSLQAHPALSPGGRVTNNEIYISYTKNDVGFGTNVYTQPLIRITWAE